MFFPKNNYLKKIQNYKWSIFIYNFLSLRMFFPKNNYLKKNTEI